MHLKPLRVVLATASVLAVLTSCSDDDPETETLIAESQGMEPTLPRGEQFTVRLIDHYRPSRADIIVFQAPDDWLSDQNEWFVKRVIGIPGDLITCCNESGWLSVNGEPLDETAYVHDDAPCAAPNSVRSCALDVPRIPEGFVFVMGDYRQDSYDSSIQVCRRTDPSCSPEQGLVPIDLVTGIVAD